MSVINILSSEYEDPNAFKNRIPTSTERQFLLLLIYDQKEELEYLELRRNMLERQIAMKRAAADEHQRTVTMAKRLEVLSHITLEKMDEISPGIHSLDVDSALWKRPTTTPSNAVFDTLLAERKRIVETHHLSLEMFQNNLDRVVRQAFAAHEELEATQSLLSVLQRSLASLILRQSQLHHEIRLKKDLIGPRRRVPSDVWAEIFGIMVEEEEAAYESTSREGSRLFRHSAWLVFVSCGDALLSTSPNFGGSSQFLEHSNSLLAVRPVVYVVPDSKRVTGSGIHVVELLKRFTSFQVLELRVSRRNSEAEDILAVLEVPIVQLKLIGTHKRGSAGTSCPLKRIALQRVQSLSCLHVQPSIRNSTPGEEEMSIIKVDFIQSNLDARPTILFLEALSSIQTVSITLSSPFFIDADGFRSSITLSCLTRVEFSLEFAHLLFPNEVSLPKLNTVVITSSTLGSSTALVNWTTFLSYHKRQESLKSLTIAALPFGLDYHDSSDSYSSILRDISSLTHLTLVGEAIEPFLRDMHLALNTNLEQLTLQKARLPCLQLVELFVDIQSKLHRPIPTLNISGTMIPSWVIDRLEAMGIHVTFT
ncbi:SubName: Full=Uncharacterized protein {ECO:0000313/EMBL:CCA71609.1} [Serendipita indica DSM 11827]|nr:SubName: Full=Uncharacterized protein {ECO:0000313/EMBL:CCA71609.1} [Serendipita indica DSM 11827]